MSQRAIHRLFRAIKAKKTKLGIGIRGTLLHRPRHIRARTVRLEDIELLGLLEL